jgi:hypothetical protein
MSWSLDGLHLLASTKDGTITCFSFQSQDLIISMKKGHEILKESQKNNVLFGCYNNKVNKSFSKNHEFSPTKKVTTNLDEYFRYKEKIRKIGFEFMKGLSKRISVIDYSILSKKTKTQHTPYVNNKLLKQLVKIKTITLKENFHILEIKVPENINISLCLMEKHHKVQSFKMSRTISIEIINKGAYCKIVTKNIFSQDYHWEAELPSRFTCAAYNLNLLVIGTLDAKLYIFATLTGSNHLPCMNSMGPPVMLNLETVGWKLLCLTACGVLCLWDLSESRLIFKCLMQSLITSLNFGESLVKIFFTVEGRPALLTTRFRSYFYIPSMDLWFCTSDGAGLSIKKSGKINENRAENSNFLNLKSIYQKNCFHKNNHEYLVRKNMELRIHGISNDGNNEDKTGVSN